MNIVYASSDSYSEVAAVSMISLLDHNQDAEELSLYYITHGVTPEHQEMLHTIAKAYGRTVVFIPLPDLEALAGSKLETGYASLSTFASCFLPVILPETLEKALLIDCDTVVRDSLQPLWDTDIGDDYVAAVDDVKSKCYRRAIGLADHAPYFNCGVMLINLALCRREKTVDQAVALLAEKQGRLLYMDQAVNNVIYKNHIRQLPLKYNCLSGLFAFDCRQLCLYKRPANPLKAEEYQEALTNPVIVHFSDNAFYQARPWIENCAHPYADVFRQYREMLPMERSNPRKDNPSRARTIVRSIYRRCPKPLVAWVFGFLQAYIQPWFKKKV